MLFRVNSEGAESLSDQLVQQVLSGIARGELKEGDRLPSAREVARALEINMHTVLRAYAGLRDRGVLAMRQGRGAWVTAHREIPTRIRELVDELLTEGEAAGFAADELARIVKGSRA